MIYSDMLWHHMMYVRHTHDAYSSLLRQRSVAPRTCETQMFKGLCQEPDLGPGPRPPQGAEARGPLQAPAEGDGHGRGEREILYYIHTCMYVCMYVCM